jgi:hypothetical protein
VVWNRRVEPVELSARGLYFGTRVDKDLIFSEQAGRNILGGATLRHGGLVAGRARGSFFDLALNATFVRSTFEDTGLVVPYVPEVVLRGDLGLFFLLPFEVLEGKLRLAGGVGYTFVGQRALPFDQRSDIISVLDANLEVSWRWFTLGVSCTNLLDTRYRLGEYNYASDFRTNGSFPTLVPARHFTAGAPRQVLGTLAFNLGGEP